MTIDVIKCLFLHCKQLSVSQCCDLQFSQTIQFLNQHCLIENLVEQVDLEICLAYRFEYFRVQFSGVVRFLVREESVVLFFYEILIEGHVTAKVLYSRKRKEEEYGKDEIQSLRERTSRTKNQPRPEHETMTQELEDRSNTSEPSRLVFFFFFPSGATSFIFKFK